MLRLLLSSALLASATLAQVTVYNPTVDSTPTLTATTAQWTGVGSQDPLKLNPPAPPAAGEQNKNVAIQLLTGGLPGLSQPTKGDFLGFSVELSVFEPLIGRNITTLRPEFLNYLAVLQDRGGGITIRVGGNTQDKARIEDVLPNGGIIEKYKGTNNAPTQTPVIHFTIDVLNAMAQVAKMLNVHYFFGVPFLETNADGNASIVTARSQEILGDSLLALQLANEPDLYARHGKKGAEYNQQSFFADTSSMIRSLPLDRRNMMGPSVCCFWETNDLLDLGYMDMFMNELKYINAMHYPTNNCDGSKVPQDEYPAYLSHASATEFVAPYILPVARATAAGKPFIMLETNTASCGGFPGVSDSFGASLWGIDMGLKMVSTNFTNAMWHVGGQNVYYNPMTPPPTNQTSFRKWSTGSIFYSNVVVAEVLGKSGKAQVVDLNLEENNNRPAYAVYEDGVPTRVAIINFVTDASGTNDFTAEIQVGGGQTGQAAASPQRVYVKYLAADSVAEKWNITWAGQTFGGQFESDGRFYGDLNVVTIECANNICPVPVKSPSAAIVYMSEAALANSQPAAGSALTFETSTLSGIATVDWSSVKASNGRNGQLPLGSTSHGSANAATGWRSRLPSTELTVSLFMAVTGFLGFQLR